MSPQAKSQLLIALEARRGELSRRLSNKELTPERRAQFLDSLKFTIEAQKEMGKP